MSLVEFKNVCKQYKMGDIKIDAVKNVSFTIEQGEFVVVVGSSGAGKTTILNILGGMDNATKGNIVVAGKDITKFSDKEMINYRRFDIGFVFQFYNLIPNLTARENIELATQICNDTMDVDDALEAVGLTDRKDNFPSQLSGGEQQRVSIARAIAKKPSLLLCDEPTGALDYLTGKSILKLLQDMCRNENETVVLITHNQAITPMADRVIKLKSGEVIENRINENPKDVDEIEW